MTTIYKYPLTDEAEQLIKLPQGSTPLHVGLDPSGTPCVWARVTTTKAPAYYVFFIVPTGGSMPSVYTEYLGTFVDGFFVGHVFWAFSYMK